MRCPWALDEQSDSCGFVQWYSILSSNGHLWSASQVLVILLQALPFFRPPEGAILFDKHCFGELPSEEAISKFSEMDHLIAYSVSFSRAQALLDLTLILYPDDNRWRGIFEVAICYHQLADILTASIYRRDMVSLPHFRSYVQKIQFERVREVLINQGPGIMSPSPASDYSILSLGHQDPRCYIICYFHFLLDSPGDAPNDTSDQDSSIHLASLLDFQLHDQGNLIGFIQALDLCFTLMRTLIVGHKGQFQTARLSSAADSFMPIPHSLKQVNRVRGLMKILEARFRDKIQNIIPDKKSAFGQLADMGPFTSGSLDVPTYIQAVHRFHDSLNLAESPKNPLFSPYVERVRKVLLEPLSMKSLSDFAELAGLIMDRMRKSIGAEAYATEMQQIETGQTSRSSSDPAFIRPNPQPNLETAVGAQARHGRALEDSFIKASLQLPGKTFSDLQNPIQTPLGNYSARDQTEKTAKEAGPLTYDGVSSSYTEICTELRAELMDCFEQRDIFAPEFAPRGTAEMVLYGPKLLRFFQCLCLPEGAIQALDPPYEETLARRFNEKRLHEFLAILIFSECDIAAAQKFTIKLLARESWAEERCSIPTSRETLTELFGDTIAPEQFLARQAIFCPAVIVVGTEVSIPNLKEQRLPYIEEEIIGKGSFGTVFKTAIAGRHIFYPDSDPHFNRFTQWTAQVARKDFTMRTDLEFRRSTAAYEIMTTILSLRKESDNVLTSLGAFCIGSLTYSLFMPLATYTLTEFMMSYRPMRPGSRDQRAAVIKNVLGLADGLDFLHTRLKTNEGDDLVCYHLDLKPENILIFPDKTSVGNIYIWKISDFAMSYVKFRRQGEVQDTVIDFKSRFIRRQEQKSQDSPASKAPDQLGEGTCLAPECMETSPNISTRSDVWSLGCVISIVFTYLDDGAEGVTKYAGKRAAHTRANGCDRFFIRGKNNQPHPAIKTWHSLLIKRARNRSKGEGKEVASILRFLETDVFQGQSKRCDARSVERRLSEALSMCEEWEGYTDEARRSGLERFLHGPMIDRIVHGRAGRRLVSRLSVGFIEPLSKSDTSPERVPISPLSLSAMSYRGSLNLEEE